MTFSVNSRNLHIVRDQAIAAGQLFGVLDEQGNPLPTDAKRDGDSLKPKARAYLDALTNIDLTELNDEIQLQIDAFIVFAQKDEFKNCVDEFYPFSKRFNGETAKDYTDDYVDDLAEIKAQRSEWNLPKIIESVQAANQARLRQQGIKGLPERGCQQEAEWDALTQYRDMITAKAEQDEKSCTDGQFWLCSIIDLIKLREAIMTRVLPSIRNKELVDMPIACARGKILSLISIFAIQDILAEVVDNRRQYMKVLADQVPQEPNAEISPANAQYLSELQKCEAALLAPPSLWTRLKNEYNNNAKFRWGVRALLFSGFVVANLFSFGAIGGMGAGVALVVKLATVLAGAYSAKRVGEYCFSGCGNEAAEAPAPQAQPAAEEHDLEVQPATPCSTSSFAQRVGGVGPAPQEMKDGPASAQAMQEPTGCPGFVNNLWENLVAANSPNPGEAFQNLQSRQQKFEKR